MTTKRQQITTFQRLDKFCGQLQDAVDRVRAAGPLNTRQLQNLFFVETTVAELRQLFKEEAQRTNCYQE